MADKSVYKLGALCSVLVGILAVVVGITGVLIPSNLSGVPNAQSPFMFFEANKVMILTNWWALFFTAVFALAVIPAVSGTVRQMNAGLVGWTSTLAMIAYAVSILDNYWAIVYTSARANAYVNGSEAVRATLSVPGAPQFIDVQNWLAYGAVGAWVLVVSWYALRGNVWPKGLAYFGIVGAFLYFAALASSILPDLVVSGASTVFAAIGGILAPIWFIWMGLFLRRIASQ